MPRQGRSGGGSRPSRGGSRPVVPASKPAPVQSRPATTSAMPPRAGPPAATGQTSGVPAVQQPQSGGGGGMMSNIISTGMGVALGHQISNGISSMFGGGSAEPPAAAESNATATSSYGDNAQQNSFNQGGACAADVKQFTSCMTENNGNMDICGWYLSQLKACQQAAKEY